MIVLGIWLLPNAGRQLRRWRACGAWRTMARGRYQAMCVRPTAGAPRALGGHNGLKVAHCVVTSRPERFAG